MAVTAPTEPTTSTSSPSSAPPTTWPDLIGDDPCIESRGIWTGAKFGLPCVPDATESSIAAPASAEVPGTLPSTGPIAVVDIGVVAVVCLLAGLGCVRVVRR